MNNIVNLTKCYIETIITMKNQVILILASALILGIFQEGFIVYGAGAAVMVLVNQVLTNEDISGVNFLIATLPVSKKEYVISRYMGGLISVLVGAVLVTGAYLIVYMFSDRELTLSYIYFLIPAIISAIIIVSINIPVFLKYGALNGRVVLTLVNMAGLFLPILIVEKISTMNVLSIFTSNDNILVLFIILVAMLILYISYCISLNLYNKKEVKK